MKTLRLAFDGTLEAPLSHRSPTLPAADYTSDMLQRTTEAPAWPDHFDYLVVERIARDIRNQYIASLISRAKKALADLRARRAAVHRTCPMTLHRPGKDGNFVGRSFRRLAAYVSRLEREQREAYLAGATDIYDLERRMRELENPISLPSRLPLR